MSSPNHESDSLPITTVSHLRARARLKMFLGRPTRVYQIAVMGFDRPFSETTSTKNFIGTVQGFLFRHLDHGNPSTLIGLKAGSLCASELDLFGRR